MTPASAAVASKGLIMHSAARHYDLLAWLLTLGRERALRERLVDLARLVPGESVLDVGCGTGSLAITAKRRVGVSGSVRGIDASAEMIAQARAKAIKAKVDVAWEIARADALPGEDRSVDVVLSTLMMHHLPRTVREAFAAEIRRVLRPGGRVLVVDFEPPAQRRGGLISRIHRHGHVPAREIRETLGRAQLQVFDAGSVGISDLHFALATPSDTGRLESAPVIAYRALPTLPVPRWLLATAVITLALIGHLLVMRFAWRQLAFGTGAALGIGALFMVHGGLAGSVHTLLRKHRTGR